MTAVGRPTTVARSGLTGGAWLLGRSEHEHPPKARKFTPSTFYSSSQLDNFSAQRGFGVNETTIAQSTGFNAGSTVKFHGTSATSVTFVSPSQLRATVPSTATTGSITVTNAAARTGTVSSATSYTKTECRVCEGARPLFDQDPSVDRWC